MTCLCSHEARHQYTGQPVVCPSNPQLTRHPTYSLSTSATQRQDRAGIIQVPYTNNNNNKLLSDWSELCFQHYNCELYIYIYIYIQSLFQYCLLNLQLDLQAHLQAVLQLDLHLDLHVDLHVILQDTSDSTIKSTTQQGTEVQGQLHLSNFHSNSSGDRTETCIIQNTGLSQKYRTESQIHLSTKLWHFERNRHEQLFI